MQLENAGWDQAWSNLFRSTAAEDLQPGRVFAANRQRYSLFTASGEIRAEVAGTLLFHAEDGGMPVVGDWVAYRQHSASDLAIIHRVFSRRTNFSRRAAGRAVNEQVVAANIDVVFIVAGLDHEFSARRIERYIASISRGGADAVVLLNKTDICADLETKIANLHLPQHVPVLRASALREEGIRELSQLLLPARTAALVGSSGVGKSTIVNALLGRNVQRTESTRAFDSRGQHTTTERELFILPQGGLILDTPGMRELQLWDPEADLVSAFADIYEISASCGFRDCRHQSEPECAVKSAVLAGQIDENRWHNYLKLQKELHHRAQEQDIHLRLAEKQRWKKLCKGVKEAQKRK